MLLEALLLAAVASAASSQTDPASGELFEKTIRPILADHCVSCHNPVLLEGGLDLTSAEGASRGATTGALVDGADPARSRLLRAVSYEDRVKMPPSGRLPRAELSALEAWVGRGAPWPDADLTAAGGSSEASSADVAAGRDHWAFQPVVDPAVPDVDGPWGRHPIDRFVHAKLDEEGLEPARQADPLTLLRRVTFDLTGLPPTESEVEAFVRDGSPDRLDDVIERLLASPRYGERWGRHWLDVARYADSTGNDEDHRYPHAWRYRDYVIEAFNDDLPYDQFVREQVAGDLLPLEESHLVEGVRRRGIIATGFLAVGPKALAQQDKKKMLYDVYDEQLDVVSKAFLGLTVTCARCHDHKFDPIPTRDYYSMVGIFAGTRSFEDSTTHVAKLLFRPLEPKDVVERAEHHRNRTLYTEAAFEHWIDRAAARRNARLGPEMDAYMLAARRVYDGRESLNGVADSKALDPAILQKWVDYLRPRDIARPHLAEWHAAEEGELDAVASRYRDNDAIRLAEWNRKIAERYRVVERLRNEMAEPPPRRPEILEGEDRFFYDVHIAGGGPFVATFEALKGELDDEERRELDRLQQELIRLDRSKPRAPDMACAVEDGDPVRQRVFLRGDYRNEGEEAPPGFLSVLESEPRAFADGDALGSGRLELARWLTKDDHPLTARVIVNRIWQWHFGEGLVRTPSNFGRMGERPSHPELLDYLARRFVRDGWSVKTLHRLILSSRTYRMASATSERASTRDPENRLLSHFNRRRLDVEEIRDGLLAVAGTLDETMGGSLDDGTGTDLENSDARLSLDPTEIPRRMVYIPLRRANLPTLLGLFDFGDAVNSNPRRSRTNVPPQALFMMNSAFVADRSRELAQELLDSETSAETLVGRLYVSILSRPPKDDELRESLDYVERYQHRFRGPGERTSAWASLARVLIASNAFIYLD